MKHFERDATGATTVNLGIMDKRIQEIRERCDRATPGPWKANWLDDCFIEPRICMIPANGCYDYDKFETNSEFIAASREDIPYLLSQLAAKDAEIERLREAQRWRDAETEPPQKEGDYLVLCESGDMYNCFYDESIEEFGYYEAIYDNRTLGYVDSEWHKNETVTHWMPLPAAREALKKGAVT